MSKRVMIYVQHLLGVGHLKRMSLLADALAAAGAEVVLISGGPPAPQITRGPKVRFEQLPPLKAKDARFSSLVDLDGEEVSEALKQERTRRLLSLLETVQPDILVVELFPLGRRQMRFELLPLLQAARPEVPRIACSVRDIINRRPHREAEALDWLNRFFDLLLVHGDEALTPIEDSVLGIKAFEGRVHHTGYITEAAAAGQQADRNEVLVSAGGGAEGSRLFETAVKASRLVNDDRIWRIRHGRDVPGETLARWRREVAPGSIIEPVAPDFAEALARAAVSVSQFGYNTAVALLQACIPAVIVPFEGAGETEQTRRAEAFQALGFETLKEAGLDPARLADAVSHAALPAGARQHIRLDGLEQSTRLLLGGWT